MSERPIIFSGPMVRALLADKKTMTRRLATSPLRKCAPGDTLWVRENLRMVSEGIEYAADGELAALLASDRACDLWNRYASDDPLSVVKCCPSIHMPRWASRITLDVTAVKIERLQEITREDALAEGVEGGCGPGYDFALHAFMCLWNRLHGPGSWDSNPEIVAISFRMTGLGPRG